MGNVEGVLPSEDDFVRPVDDDLKCLICYSLLQQPVLTRCGHRFCRLCLEQHLKRQVSEKQETNCPVDRKVLLYQKTATGELQDFSEIKDIFPDKATERKICSLSVKCLSTGCKWTGELREKENHLSACGFKLVVCTNCQVQVARKDLEKHVTTACEWRIITCEHCSEPHPKYLFEDHINNCNKKAIECLNGCGKLTVREGIGTHLVSECPLSIIPCPYEQIGCSVKFMPKGVHKIAYSVDKLQERRTKTYSTTGMFYRSREGAMSEISLIPTTRNFRVENDCCVHFIQIPRKEVESHLQSARRDHVDLTCATLQATTGKLEQRICGLEKQVKELADANSALSSKLDAQSKELLILKNESPTFVWRVDDVNEILNKAKKSGGTYSLFSEPFYTGKPGYKLIARLYPDGDQTNRNRYLSVRICVMRHKYDATLSWPFYQKVTFTLIDQQDDEAARRNVRHFFITNPSCPSTARPTTEQNEVCGIASFVSHKILRTRRYVVDDTLFLTVEVTSP